MTKRIKCIYCGKENEFSISDGMVKCPYCREVFHDPLTENEVQLREAMETVHMQINQGMNHKQSLIQVYMYAPDSMYIPCLLAREAILMGENRDRILPFREYAREALAHAKNLEDYEACQRMLIQECASVINSYSDKILQYSDDQVDLYDHEVALYAECLKGARNAVESKIAKKRFDDKVAVAEKGLMRELLISTKDYYELWRSAYMIYPHNDYIERITWLLSHYEEKTPNEYFVDEVKKIHRTVMSFQWETVSKTDKIIQNTKLPVICRGYEVQKRIFDERRSVAVRLVCTDKNVSQVVLELTVKGILSGVVQKRFTLDISVGEQMYDCLMMEYPQFDEAEIDIISIVYKDGTAREFMDGNFVVLDEFPTQEERKAAERLGYSIDVIPEKFDTYWRCVCGTCNDLQADRCRICGREKEKILAEVSASAIQNEIERENEEKRQQDEKEDRERRERADAAWRAAQAMNETPVNVDTKNKKSFKSVIKKIFGK